MTDTKAVDLGDLIATVVDAVAQSPGAVTPQLMLTNPTETTPVPPSPWGDLAGTPWNAGYTVGLIYRPPVTQAPGGLRGLSALDAREPAAGPRLSEVVTQALEAAQGHDVSSQGGVVWNDDPPPVDHDPAGQPPVRSEPQPPAPVSTHPPAVGAVTKLVTDGFITASEGDLLTASLLAVAADASHNEHELDTLARAVASGLIASDVAKIIVQVLLSVATDGAPTTGSLGPQADMSDPNIQMYIWNMCVTGAGTGAAIGATVTAPASPAGAAAGAVIGCAVGVAGAVLAAGRGKKGG